MRRSCCVSALFLSRCKVIVIAVIVMIVMVSVVIMMMVILMEAVMIVTMVLTVIISLTMGLMKMIYINANTCDNSQNECK
jgi:hypothetical protein